MHKTISRNRVSIFINRTVAFTFFAAAATLGLNAQQSAGTAHALPPINLKSSLIAPLDLSSSSSDDLNFTSSTGVAETAAAESFNLSGREDQPPPRRRYGRPNYNDKRTNPDGSSKYTFAVGGGMALPIGNTHKYLTPSWNLQLGGGRNFNKTFGVLLQFDYANFGFQGSTLQNQQDFYNQGLSSSDPNYITGLDGSSHVWSFTLNPIMNFYTSDNFGAYVIGGLGLYHKTATFTVPSVGQYCDPYYGYCYQYQANQPIDKYTSNALGLNGGIGLTYKGSRFSSVKFYTEARYVWVDNQPRPFSYNKFNYYPQNTNRTGYIPITVGIRW